MITTVPPAALQAERVATLFRRIVLLVGGQLLVTGLGQVLMAAAAEGPPLLLLILSLLVLLGTLAASVASVVFTYQLMQELGSPVPWLWAAASFVPCVSILVLLALSQRAQAWCKERGIRVGLLGPTRESIEQLKRQSSVDQIFK